MRSAIGVTLFLLLLLIVTAPVHAQRVIGRTVEEPGGGRISYVQLSLVAADSTIVRSTSSDSAGYFVLAGDVGHYRIGAARIGYASYISEPIELKRDETVTVTIRLAAEGIPLPPLEVHARGDERGRDGFERRRALGKGVFLTLDSIRERKPIVTSDLFDGISGVLVFEGPDGGGTIFPLTGAKCFKIYRDNMPFAFSGGAMPDLRAMLGMPGRYGTRGNSRGGGGAGGGGGGSGERGVNSLDVAWLRGIEIYRDMTEVPDEVRRSRKMFDMWPPGGVMSGGRIQIEPCGVVWIWTTLGW